MGTYLRNLRTAATLSALILVPALAQANVIWNWNFGSDSGTFTTDGSQVSGVAAAGTYNFVDFSVTSSSLGGTPGSLSGGQYLASGFNTTTPYSFNWNGSAVTFWDSAGSNTFNWWVFSDQTPVAGTYFFGWATNNINDPAQATYYLGNISQPSYRLRVSVAGGSTVPEPGTLALLALGLAGLGFRRGRKS